jgi:hypothetical protein
MGRARTTHKAKADGPPVLRSVELAGGPADGGTASWDGESELVTTTEVRGLGEHDPASFERLKAMGLEPDAADPVEVTHTYRRDGKGVWRWTGRETTGG